MWHFSGAPWIARIRLGPFMSDSRSRLKRGLAKRVAACSRRAAGGSAGDDNDGSRFDDFIGRCLTCSSCCHVAAEEEEDDESAPPLLPLLCEHQTRKDCVR